MSLDSHQPAASEHTANMNVRPDLTVNSTDSDTRAREDPNEVSYTIVPVSHELVDQVLQSVATAINLRLSLEQNQPFPFVEFDSFSAALKQDKVFLYGPGGSGKSRSIFELLSRGILHFDRIIIVNPRNNVGTESGRIPLAELGSPRALFLGEIHDEAVFPLPPAHRRGTGTGRQAGERVAGVRGQPLRRPPGGKGRLGTGRGPAGPREPTRSREISRAGSSPPTSRGRCT